MDFLTIVLQFFNTYQTILIPLLTLGLVNMVSNTYAMTFSLFSVVSFGLFIYFGIVTYMYIAIASIILGFVLKNIGL